MKLKDQLPKKVLSEGTGKTYQLGGPSSRDYMKLLYDDNDGSIDIVIKNQTGAKSLNILEDHIDQIIQALSDFKGKINLRGGHKKKKTSDPAGYYKSYMRDNPLDGPKHGW